jgi:hypothetical protein
MSRRHAWWFPIARVAIPLIVLAACVKVWSPAVRVPGASAPLGATSVAVPTSSVTAPTAQDATTLKVHLNNRQLWILNIWQEDTSTKQLTGLGNLYGIDRQIIRGGRAEIPFDSIALLEAYGSRQKGSFGLALLSVWSVGTGIITGTCLADPKSCFGSCPTFYVAGDTGIVQAEGFSGSPLRLLEEQDVDHLFRLDPPAGPFVITMRNEALETHAVRQVRLLLVDRPADGRVFQTSDGTFRPATQISAPLQCASADGDCREGVRMLDESEWSSRTDSTDLGAREQIELTFAASDLGIDRTRPATIGVVLGGRNTLVSTFLFYQALAFAGSRAGEMLAAIERGTKDDLPPVFGVLREMATIHVQVSRGEGPWQSAGAYREAGPIATDVRVLPVTLSPGAGPIRVRLDLARGFWRLNQVALARLGDAVTPAILEPMSVDHVNTSTINAGSGAAINPLTVLNDAEHHLVTYPGDEYALRFALPARTNSAARELFLESTGYYYEWMRQEWLPEENAAKAAQLLYTPAAALKALAPRFKAREASMDSVFWNSRVGRVRP